MPFPMGMGGIRWSQIIDLDQCGVFFLESADRPGGKAFVGVRLRDFGPYNKGEKSNLMLAICGEDGNDGQPSCRWRMVWNDGGTTIEKMLEFLQEILDELGHANENGFHVFTMDNLNSHRNEAVVALIHLYRHRIVYRAPFWAVDAPIEYVFHTLQSLLRAQLHTIMNIPDLNEAINQSIQGMIDFGSYFNHVGLNLV